MSDDMDDFLAHHGVLGMHWGHHKNNANSVAKATTKRVANNAEEKAAEKPSTKTKVSSADIRAARKRLGDQLNVVYNNSRNVSGQTTDKGRAKAQKIFDESVKTYENSSDWEAANRSTGAEKASIILGVAGTAAYAGFVIARKTRH